LKDGAARLKTAASVALLLLFAVPTAWSIVAAAEDQECPFAGKRPPMAEILKLPKSQRPPLCKADLREANLTGAILIEANLVGANLTKAKLREANLNEASLVEANLTAA